MSHHHHQQQQQHHHHQRRGGRFIPPKVGSIHHGSVTRIESYGCFVKFTYNNDETTDNNSNSISGLVHISQCSKMKITNVNDVVSLNDMVYIKIMEVTQPDDGGGRHYKVKLSMKYVHQDTGQDLDPDGVLMEEDLFRQRSSNNNNNNGQHYNQGGRRDENVDGTGGANSMLGRSLASNIGMSSAIDPGSLILKGRSGGTSNNSATFNGYSLVGEDEGELPPDDTAATTANKSLREDPTPSSSSTVRPMGRGRATTLPAWMTRQDNDNNATGSDERLGSMKDEKGPLDIRRRRKYDDHDDDDESNSNDNADDRRRRKHHRKDRKQRHRSHKRSSRKKHKRQRDSRRRSSRSRSHSYSISSDYDDNSSSSLYSRSRSRSPSYRKKKRKDKNKKKRSKHRDDGHHRRDKRDYYSSGSSRSRSRDRSNKHEGHSKEKEGRSSSSPSGFVNVDEARAIMEKLERRQQER